jgi:peptidyl-prolyl cis-trans isomerase SurA
VPEFAMRKLAVTVLCGIAISLAAFAPTVVLAQDQKVIVTVNDSPITSYDIQQRINLWKLLGDNSAKKDGARKRALNELIDDIAKINEAKKSGFAPTEKDVDNRLSEVSKGLKTDDKGLVGKLRSQGISMAAMRQYLTAQISFGRILNGKLKVNFDVSADEVKKRQSRYRAEIDGKINAQIAKIESDPRRRAINVYQLMRIQFPIDGTITSELLNSRAVEVNTYLGRFNGCGNARKAASGIFNVQVGKKFDVDAAQLQKPMRETFERIGAGKAVGPARYPNGLEAVAFCGSRKIVPPKVERPKNVAYPTSEQVKGVLLQEKYEQIASKYGSQFRKGLLIEYRDPTYGP